MSWLTEKISNLNIRDEKELWTICPKCHTRFPHDLYPHGFDVCPACNAPSRLSCRTRIERTVDPNSFTEINADISISDPLSFSDASGSYLDKAASVQAKTGLKESVLTGTGRIHGHEVVLCVMDFRFFGGSLSSGAGEKIVRAAELALNSRLPLIIFCASGGARMHEGIISLMQMARTCAAIARLQAAGLPYISVLTDPTTGGVSASFALTADVVLSEPHALIGFAGRRVIENTIKQKLPDDFQTAEYLLTHGFIDAIVERNDLPNRLADLLSAFHPSQIAPSAISPLPPPSKCRPKKSQEPWKTVQIARDPTRPTIRNYISLAFDSFFELHGDRLFGDDSALIGGIASIADVQVMLLGHQKGRNAEENIKCNFGMANPEGYRKALRLMKLAEAWNLPVISLVDTAGAFPGLEAETRGQAEAIGRNLCTMARLKTPLISVITGEGGSGGAIGIAAADRILMLENAVYSVISPEGCASILWKDGKFAPEAAAALKITAPSLLSLGVIDAIIQEPKGGAQADPTAAANFLKLHLAATLRNLLSENFGSSPDSVAERRYAKFLAMGRQFYSE